MDWLSRYNETWADLLDVFGALSIVQSEYIDTIPSDPERVPTDVGRPLAMNMQCACWLAGLAGCDTKQIEDNLIRFEGGNISLQFVSNGSFRIGTYEQKVGWSTYLSYDHHLVGMATVLASGSLVYCQNESAPIDRRRGDEVGDDTLSADLHSTRCACSNQVDIDSTQCSVLMSCTMAFLAADSPLYVRAVAPGHWKIPEMIDRLAQQSRYWIQDPFAITAISFAGEGNLAAIGMNIISVGHDEAFEMPFMLDQYDARLRTHDIKDLKFINLAWSWLSKAEDYPPARQGRGSSVNEGRIFQRPCGSRHGTMKSLWFWTTCLLHV